MGSALRASICLLGLATGLLSGCGGREATEDKRPSSKRVVIEQGPETEVRRELSDRGDAVSFALDAPVAGGRKALLHLFVSPPGTTEDAAREVVRTAAERYRVPGDRTELEPIRMHRWATAEFAIRRRGTGGAPLAGWVALRSQGGHWFHIIAEYPERVRAYFAPPIERILAEWRWGDTGRGLTPSD